MKLIVSFLFVISSLSGVLQAQSEDVEKEVVQDTVKEVLLQRLPQADGLKVETPQLIDEKVVIPTQAVKTVMLNDSIEKPVITETKVDLKEKIVKQDSLVAKEIVATKENLVPEKVDLKEKTLTTTVEKKQIVSDVKEKIVKQDSLVTKEIVATKENLVSEKVDLKEKEAAKVAVVKQEEGKKTKKKKKKKRGKKIINTTIPPSSVFDLSDWSLSVPVDADNNGKADQVREKELVGAYANEFFYLSEDGGMVFKCPIEGYKTSKNTTYTRSELREMLRAGDYSVKTKGPTKNNWVFEGSPSVNEAGGYGGKLTATLAVNHVTETGKASHVGRVIIGQIHAHHNEPLRLYYRKLPNNKKGSIYFAHEGRVNGEEDFYELIGGKSNSLNDPSDGIALNEKFSYEVIVAGAVLSIRIIRPNKPVIHKVISMAKSDYAVKDEYMYFKAGVYNQNKTVKPTDYVQATFYELSNSHTTK